MSLSRFLSFFSFVGSDRIKEVLLLSVLPTERRGESERRFFVFFLFFLFLFLFLLSFFFHLFPFLCCSEIRKNFAFFGLKARLQTPEYLVSSLSSKTRVFWKDLREIKERKERCFLSVEMLGAMR